MQPDDWHERWRSGRTGFHLSTTHPELARHWPAMGVPPHARVLVPLCGMSLDLLWLHAAGHAVVGVELSEVALETFCSRHGIAARRRTLGAFDAFESHGLALLCGDWFDLTATEVGSADAVYDRAALVAFPLAQQRKYLEKLAALTVPGVPALLIAVEYDQAQMPGPPFSVSRAELGAGCGDAYTIEELGRREVLADEPRMRERGLTRLQEVAYRLTRR